MHAAAPWHACRNASVWLLLVGTYLHVPHLSWTRSLIVLTVSPDDAKVSKVHSSRNK